MAGNKLFTQFDSHKPTAQDAWFGHKEKTMTSETGIIRCFNPKEKKGLITSDLGGDICFDISSISSNNQPVSGSLVEFIMDDSSNKLQAVKVRFI
ncbi:cold shock domain-containing protein [Photobacterium lipolyticum]|nr:cold shock domain-containing protein [Photobacterium lipolyticum]